jgi:hypothetical protein
MTEAMQHLDLDDAEATALVVLLTRTITDDRYPPSPRVRTLKAILAKLRPEPVREPLPPPKVYAPPRAAHSQKAPARLKPYRGPPMTLGNAAASQVLIIWCLDCRH